MPALMGKLFVTITNQVSELSRPSPPHRADRLRSRNSDPRANQAVAGVMIPDVTSGFGKFIRSQTSEIKKRKKKKKKIPPLRKSDAFCSVMLLVSGPSK